MTPYGVKKSRKPKLLTTRAKTLLALLFLLLCVCYAGWHYRNALAYYFSYRTVDLSEEQKIHALRNFQVLSSHPGLSVGFDVSQYQGEIKWTLADSIDNRFPVDFVFIRATAGTDFVDNRFSQNWEQSAQTNLIRGAYHYYRPDENSIEQAKNFIAAVRLQKGDLPPVLDIEQLPSKQPIDSLRAGLRRWLAVVEKHYQIRPIIYSGASFYSDFLKDEFEGYYFWIANYNFFVERIDDRWSIWQFSEKAAMPGIRGPVDVNLFNGSRRDLQELTKK